MPIIISFNKKYVNRNSIEITYPIEYIDINKLIYAYINCCGKPNFFRIPPFFLNPVGFCESNRG